MVGREWTEQDVGSDTAAPDWWEGSLQNVSLVACSGGRAVNTT